MSDIAIIFDFDDTIVPDSTTQLLQSKGIDVDEFWGVKHKALLERGYDAPHGYLKLLLDMTEAGQPFHGLKNADLRAFGSTLNPYPGVVTLFNDLKNIAQELDERTNVHFYVISGGLLEVVKGCTKISKHLSGIWGCRLASDTNTGPVKYIQNVITFTEKTRYLFEINKGLSPADTEANPYLVNRDIPEGSRPIPFKNMIYIGDGLTDIPCFSLIKKNRGYCYGIMHRDRDGNPKRKVIKELIHSQRIMSLHSPNYGKKQDLGGMLRGTVAHIAANIKLEQEQALI